MPKLKRAEDGRIIVPYETILTILMASMGLVTALFQHMVDIKQASPWEVYPVLAIFWSYTLWIVSGRGLNYTAQRIQKQLTDQTRPESGV